VKTQIVDGKIDCPFEGIISPEECGEIKNQRCEYCFIYKAVEDDRYLLPKTNDSETIN